MELNHEELKEFLHHVYENKLALFVQGATGIGKSAQISATAQEIAEKEGRSFIAWNKTSRAKKLELMKDPSKHFIYVDMRISQMDPTDVRGVPNLFTGEGAAIWDLPIAFNALAHPQAKGILFFDEMNLAPQSIQAATYSIVLDREVGEVSLADGVSVIAAGNRESDRAAVHQLSAPLNNRFMHVELGLPTITAWQDWALKNDIDLRVVGFLNFLPKYLYAWKADSAEKAFPTPRSWAAVSKLIKTFGHDTADQVRKIKLFAEATVGNAAAVSLASFIEVRLTYDPIDFIIHPEKASSLKGAKPDVKWSLITAFAEYYKNLPKKLKDHAKVNKDFNFIENCFSIASELEPDYGILMFHMCRSLVSDAKWITDAQNSDAFRKFIAKHKSLATLVGKGTK